MSRIRETVAHRVERAKAAAIDPLAVVDDEFWTNKAIAARYAISVDTVTKAQDSGELVYCAFGDRAGRHPRRSSPRRAVLAWAAARLVVRST